MKRKASKSKPASKPRGRPTKFTPARAAKICAELSEGKPLTLICKSKGMPCDSTVRDWVKAHPKFAEDYRFAREMGFDAIAWQILAIADNTGHEDKDTIKTDFGDVPNKEWVMRSKLRVDARFRLLRVWDPSRYGEKVATEITGKDGGALKIVADEETLSKIKAASAIASFVRPPGAYFSGERKGMGG
ncbi:hypothetical protein OKA04_15830 [Luteolibacter flavescens]|uniref:Terminase small subunit protein n=1 Tax=Luteolibacter flavescens TaxID=1859460 RepID=A0ABT3FRK0_9BACT|nr:hypothetical protein [Luteolibacter flavescens]MCW1886208.1 hypothetical protein [Luteolibacter flavescens]